MPENFVRKVSKTEISESPRLQSKPLYIDEVFYLRESPPNSSSPGLDNLGWLRSRCTLIRIIRDEFWMISILLGEDSLSLGVLSSGCLGVEVSLTIALQVR
ncbi:UNVERIFIED_CONTAM: hypothetical protein Sradi_3653900 [Sesamum radiatum]|uniref:Uncharacterized protein n=1 Tax=Sesamum radiatum TaxID=300843 RepID=A0AAW2QII6_SESRA